MKARLPLAIALAIGLLLGAIGTLTLCSQGYCGNGSNDGQQASSQRTTPEFGAGSPWWEFPAIDPSATPTSTSTPRSPSATATPVATGVESPGEPQQGDARQITGLAIIGDSTQDEYRADDLRGGEFASTTFSWVELLAEEAGLPLGPWGSRPEPRRDGYEFNWARSGATSKTMIESGQHTSVAEQIRAGEASHVLIQIGINDFYRDNAAIEIYTGQLTGEELERFLDDIIANVELAVQTVKVVGEDRIIVAPVQDYISPGILPGVNEVFPDEAGRQRVVDAFEYIGEGIRAMAESEGVSFFDFNAALEQEIENRVDPTDERYILVGGERIDVTAKSNAPGFIFVDDGYAHPGTVFAGLIANLYIDQMNTVFDVNVDQFSDDELLSIAGMR